MKPELLLFTDHYPFGSTEPFLADELPYLLTLFQQIKIIPLDTSGDSIQRPVPDGIEVIRPPCRNFKSKTGLLLRGITGKGDPGILFRELLSSRAWMNPSKFLHWFTVSLLIRAYLPVFLNLVRKVEHPEDAFLYFYWGQRWSQILPLIDPGFKEVVLRIHGSDLYEELYHGYIPFREQQLHRATRIFSISSFGKEYLSKRYPACTSKIDLARLGTQDHGLNAPRSEKLNSYTLVSCASVSKTKRVPLIAEILHHTDLPIHWVHFGDGPEMGHLRSACQKLPKTVTCTLKGHMTPDELFHFYSLYPADLFINVSSSEGVPVSIMEALSFGIPVMATDVGGTGELVNDTNGKLILRDFSPSETGKLLETMLLSKTIGEMRVAARKTWAERADSATVYPEFIKKLTACFSTATRI